MKDQLRLRYLKLQVFFKMVWDLFDVDKVQIQSFTIVEQKLF